MKVYYARSISLYDTAQDQRDIAVMKELGWTVVDPNQKEYQEEYKVRGMDVFRSLVEDCDALVFRAHPDGSIPRGVAREIAAAKDKPVLELPNSILKRTLSVEETREYLENVGYR